MSELPPTKSEKTPQRIATEEVITKRLRSSRRWQRAAVATSVLLGISAGATLREDVPVELSVGLLASVLPVAAAQRLERRSAYKTCDSAADAYRETLQGKLENSRRADTIGMSMEENLGRWVERRLSDPPKTMPPVHASRGREYAAYFVGSAGGFIFEKALQDDLGLEQYQTPLLLLGVAAMGAAFTASETSHPAMDIDTYTVYLDRVEEELRPQQ